MQRGLLRKFTVIILDITVFIFFLITSFSVRSYSHVFISGYLNKGSTSKSIENRQNYPLEKADLSTNQAGELNYEMHLPAGWSMMSLPVIPVNASLFSLFHEAVVIYGYEKGKGYVRITKKEDLEKGIGYWVPW